MTLVTASQRMLHFIAIASALLATGCGEDLRPDVQSIHRKIQFMGPEAIQGSQQFLQPKTTLLIGEIHGTWEIPVAVASLVRDSVARDHETIVCLEVPSTEQAAIGRFLDSDGAEAAIRDLLKPPFWLGQDGRASVGMFALLELVRRLRSEGHNVDIQAIDYDWSTRPDPEPPDHRDRTMAENLLRVRKGAPDAVLITLAGNVHTKSVKGAPWDANYTPMGWFVSQALPDTVSLDIAISGGEAWVMTERSAGPTRMVGQDRGEQPFLEVDENSTSGYDGTLYIGRISAAKPVIALPGG